MALLRLQDKFTGLRIVVIQLAATFKLSIKDSRIEV